MVVPPENAETPRTVLLLELQEAPPGGPDAIIAVRTNLEHFAAPIQMALQLILDRARLALLGARALETYDPQVPGTFLHVHTAENQMLPLDALKGQTERWILGCAVRDAVELLSDSLVDARRILGIWSMHGKVLPSEDVNRNLSEADAAFARMGLPQKLAALQSKHAFGLEEEARLMAASLQQARNCLTHRGGTVDPIDLKGRPSLVVQWKEFAILAGRLDAPRRLKKGGMAQAGEEVRVGRIKEVREFPPGTEMAFDVDDVGSICQTIVLIAEHIGARLQERKTHAGLP